MLWLGYYPLLLCCCDVVLALIWFFIIQHIKEQILTDSLYIFSGTEETHHRKESHGGWACHKCGWTHPNQHPSAKQRRNHKKHCGKIEGFKLINSGDTEKRGASSEEVSSDEEHKSTG